MHYLVFKKINFQMLTSLGVLLSLSRTYVVANIDFYSVFPFSLLHKVVSGCN